MDAKAQKLLKEDARALLGKVADKLASVETWSVEAIETAIREIAESEELKLGKVAQPLRAAMTGTNVSPGIFDVLEVLGREEVLGRLNDQST